MYLLKKKRPRRYNWYASELSVYARVTRLCTSGASRGRSFSAIAFVALFLQELHFKEPILDLRILKLRIFDAALGVTVTFSAVLFGTLLLSPVFLQELMGYTAWKAGLVQAPRGIGAMTSMMVVGQLASFGVDTRKFIGLGFILVTIGCWFTSQFDLQAGMWQIIWPTMVMGFGFGMVFPPSSAAAISCVSRERMGYASSLYNMIRNTGAAIGIAWMTNSLVSLQQIHQARLVEHFSVFDAWRFNNIGQAMPGSPTFGVLPQLITGQKQGFGMVYGAIQAQSTMLSFNDIYRILAVITLIMIPSFLLLRGATGSGGGAPAH